MAHPDPSVPSEPDRPAAMTGRLDPGLETRLRDASPGALDVEARRAKAAIEGRLFRGHAERLAVGRYRLQSRIGAGGMGVVYRAHDPELDRDVALKLLNPDAVDVHNAEVARTRLVREARMMARLADPHVIHVYDVGTFEEGVFVAMELVEGHSLAAWLETPRPWRAVLAALLEAGRGLVAAHAAGIVHRDFKPENVLVGDDGRVRVGDFGLAGGPPSHTEELPWTDDTPIALTRTGAWMGTPKYMAPEQEHGWVADATSDQFSYCVTAFEALYRRPAFAGTTVSEYRANVRAGAIASVPSGELPSALASLLRTGLDPDPARRHADMATLLAALESLVHPPARMSRSWRRRLVAGLGIVAVATVAAGVGWRLGGSAPTLAPTWSDPTSLALLVEEASDLRGPLPIMARPLPLLEPPIPSAAGPEPQAESRAVAKSKRLGAPCYWKEDTLHHLTHQRNAAHPLLWSQSRERCFDCSRPAQSYDIAKLGIPSGTQCTQHWLCRTVESDRCSSPRSHALPEPPSAQTDD